MLIAGSGFLMSSTCSNDDDNNNSNVNIQELTNIASEGTWIVSSYVDSGEDETYHFNGYTFDFNENGTVVATNGSNTIEGSWSVTNSSSSDDDNSSSGPEFVLFFNVSAASEFEDLNDDWDINTYNNNLIDLYDVSGGDGTTDVLIFSKQ